MTTVYEVDGIINDKFFPKRYQNQPQRRWLVKWTGYSKFDNTWEPRDHLEHLEYFQQYEQKRLAKKVSRIIKDKIDGTVRVWFVKWEGKSHKHNQWEPRERLKDLQIFKQYEANKKFQIQQIQNQFQISNGKKDDGKILFHVHGYPVYCEKRKTNKKKRKRYIISDDEDENEYELNRNRKKLKRHKNSNV